MNEVLPELKAGDVLVKADAKGAVNEVTVLQVRAGRDFDEPVYRLQGSSGVTLRNAYTGEELARLGYRLKDAGAA